MVGGGGEGPTPAQGAAVLSGKVSKCGALNANRSAKMVRLHPAFLGRRACSIRLQRRDAGAAVRDDCAGAGAHLLEWRFLLAFGGGSLLCLRRCSWLSAAGGLRASASRLRSCENRDLGQGTLPPPSLELNRCHSRQGRTAPRCWDGSSPGLGQ
jgi:hypothetical protein